VAGLLILPVVPMTTASTCIFQQLYRRFRHRVQNQVIREKIAESRQVRLTLAWQPYAKLPEHTQHPAGQSLRTAHKDLFVSTSEYGRAGSRPTSR